MRHEGEIGQIICVHTIDKREHDREPPLFDEVEIERFPRRRSSGGYGQSFSHMDGTNNLIQSLRQQRLES